MHLMTDNGNKHSDCGEGKSKTDSKRHGSEFMFRDGCTQDDGHQWQDAGRQYRKEARDEREQHAYDFHGVRLKWPSSRTLPPSRGGFRPMIAGTRSFLVR
jgi:hypothetical protein